MELVGNFLIALHVPAVHTQAMASSRREAPAARNTIPECWQQTLRNEMAGMRYILNPMLCSDQQSPNKGWAGLIALVLDKKS